MTNDQETKFATLRRLNIIAAILHLISGTAMLILSSDLMVPITASFLRYNLITKSLQPLMDTLFSVKLGPLVASFLFMSALAHFLIAFPLRNWYQQNLEKHINKLRWIEYAFSSSTMIVVIALLVGISDIATLIVMFFLNAMMILFGWMMELHNQTTGGKTNWTAFIFGCLAGIGPWIAIAIYLISPGSTDNPPTFVYWIFVSIFVFFNIFAGNQVLQYRKKGKWIDYLYGEKGYIILSLVAKSLLAWQVFFGTLRP